MAASMAACWLAMTSVSAAEPAQQKADAQAAAAGSKSRDKSADKAADSKAASKAANNKAGDKKEPDCVMSTGSRIRRDPPQVCAPGEHVYTAEELATTGELDTSEALRKLDPRFQ